MAAAPENLAPRRVTRDVELSALRDLLDGPRQGTVAVVLDDAIDVLPAEARCSGDLCKFGLLCASPDLDDLEVVLVIDEGPFWFQLRGASFRGIARRSEPPEPGTAERLVWYALEPRRILAWDYGSIREQ